MLGCVCADEVGLGAAAFGPALAPPLSIWIVDGLQGSATAQVVDLFSAVPHVFLDVDASLVHDLVDRVGHHARAAGRERSLDLFLLQLVGGWLPVQRDAQGLGVALQLVSRDAALLRISGKSHHAPVTVAEGAFGLHLFPPPVIKGALATPRVARHALHDALLVPFRPLFLGLGQGDGLPAHAGLYQTQAFREAPQVVHGDVLARPEGADPRPHFGHCPDHAESLDNALVLDVFPQVGDLGIPDHPCERAPHVGKLVGGAGEHQKRLVKHVVEVQACAACNDVRRLRDAPFLAGHGENRFKALGLAVLDLQSVEVDDHGIQGVGKPLALGLAGIGKGRQNAKVIGQAQPLDGLEVIQDGTALVGPVGLDPNGHAGITPLRARKDFRKGPLWKELPIEGTRSDFRKSLLE